MTKPIGFATGCFWQHLHPASQEVVDLIRSTGATAIELSLVNKERMLAFLHNPVDLTGFEYVSVHGPKLVSAELLDLLVQCCDLYQPAAVTVHPDAVDHALLKQVDLPWAFENMDVRKKDFKYAKDFSSLKNFTRFVFDVNHVYTLDPTLALTKEFEEFFSLITHIHFSGVKEKNGFLNHHPVFDTKQDELFSALPDAPIIIESEFTEIEGDIRELAQKEYNYVLTHVRSS